MAILVATTLGSAADTVRAQVRAQGLRGGAYRLIVQSYDADDDARPVGSAQRAVTADQLREGVQVSLLELRGGARADGRVVAWVEPAGAEDEFDGRTARPAPGSLYGVAKRAGRSDVQIRLKRKLAA